MRKALSVIMTDSAVAADHDRQVARNPLKHVGTYVVIDHLRAAVHEHLEDDVELRIDAAAGVSVVPPVDRRDREAAELAAAAVVAHTGEIEIGKVLTGEAFLDLASPALAVLGHE